GALLATDPRLVDATQVRAAQRAEGGRQDHRAPLPPLRRLRGSRVLALPHARLGGELGGFGETPAVPPDRAARPDPASSVAPVVVHYRDSLRPCLRTSIAPRRRATFRQTLLAPPVRAPVSRRPHRSALLRREPRQQAPCPPGRAGEPSGSLPCDSRRPTSCRCSRGGTS